MRVFVGRGRELAVLDRLLTVAGAGGDRPGRALLVRGRRRIGKSRLVEEFVHRAGAPSLFFTAVGREPTDEISRFLSELATSTLPDATRRADVAATTWDAALALLADTIPSDRTSVVVLDEVPYLTLRDPAFEGSLQAVWDRRLSRLPVLLVLIGSDLAVMEALSTYGRPFHQRAAELVVPPLSPREIADLLALPAPDAIDAALVTGGLPLVAAEWEPGFTLWDHLATVLQDPVSAFVVSAERTLAAEFPPTAQAREVLTAVGWGERTAAGIARAAGALQSASVQRSLSLLGERRVVAAERPLSTQPSRETRYRVADPYLRFWLRFVGPFLPEIERGRGDRIVARARDEWSRWRGRAVEPLIRESLHRMDLDEVLPHRSPDRPTAIGGYWTRSNDVEVDLVVADREPVARSVLAVGSIMWSDTRPFRSNDLADIAAGRSRVPGADDSLLFAVSRAGADSGLGLPVLGPEDLLAAW